MRYRICLSIAAGVLAAALAAAGCGGHNHEASALPAPAMNTEPAAAGETTRPAEDGIAQKECPVMGGPIDKKFYADHQGRRIYFCCAGCINVFKKDPEKYIKIVDEELKAQAQKSEAK